MAALESAKAQSTPGVGGLKRSARVGVKVHNLIMEYFDQGEFEMMVFELGIDYDELSGSNMAERVLSLVKYLMRHDRLQELILLGQVERPFVEWPLVPGE